ncbi:MAG: zinc ribbon domain-containing protein [Clostridia bacterium]|nr:zinc ribbon domain-containing protein [Clostridia bacterium]
MPLLQYRCARCKKTFEELVKRFDNEVFCPDCGGKCERSYSGEVFSSTGKPAKKCNGNCKTCGGCK